MKTLTLLLCALLLAPAAAGAATVYQWKDASGRVHYSDQPPPTSARVHEKDLKGSSIEQDKLSFAARKAGEAFPVVLYSAENCPGCESGRGYLAARKIPFTEKKINSAELRDEAAKLLGGKEISVPFIVIGGKVHKGWLESEWAGALDAAGYPAGKAK